MDLIQAGARVLELGQLNREGLAFLKGPSAHRIGWAYGWTVAAVPKELIGPHVSEGVLS